MMIEPPGHRFRISVFILGSGVDAVVFYALLGAGVPWYNAQFFSFLTAALPVIAMWASVLPGGGAMRRVFAPALIQAMVFFLRGGLLSVLVVSAGIPPAAAAPLAIVLTHLATLGGALLWLFPRPAPEDAPYGWGRPLVIVLVACAVALRLVYAPSIELLHEEAYYWNYAQHLDIGYLDHPPMVAWLIWLSTSLFGVTEFAVRLGALACWFVTAFFMYRLTREIAGPAAALRALLLVAVLPAFVGTGFFMTPDPPLVASWAASLYFLKRALVDEKRGAWIWAGLCLGLGLLSKYPIVLLGLSVPVFMLLDRRSRKWFVRPEPYLAAGLALLLFTPVILWNARHEWVSFAYQSTGRLTGRFQFGFGDLLAGSLALATPTGFAASFGLLYRRRSIRPEPEAAPSKAAFRFLVMSTFLPFMVFALFSFSREIKLHWTAPLWLGVVPYLSLSMRRTGAAGTQESAPSGPLPRIVAASWRPTIAVVLLLYGAILYHWAVGFPGVPINPSTNRSANVARPDFARQIGIAQEEFERRTGEHPIIVCADRDQLAGWIAFYRTKEAACSGTSGRTEFVSDVTGGHLFGSNSHMYRLWHPLRMFTGGRAVMIVAKRLRDMEDNDLLAAVEPIGDVVEFVPRKHGKPTYPCYYRFARVKPAPAGDGSEGQPKGGE